jgi:hypothetical protein
MLLLLTSQKAEKTATQQWVWLEMVAKGDEGDRGDEGVFSSPACLSG